MIGVEFIDHVETCFGNKGGVEGADNEYAHVTEFFVVLHYLIEFTPVDLWPHQILDKKINVLVPQNGKCSLGVGRIKVLIACAHQDEVEQVKNFSLGM